VDQGRVPVQIIQCLDDIVPKFEAVIMPANNPARRKEV
jgi:hypothetical protein